MRAGWAERHNERDGNNKGTTYPEHTLDDPAAISSLHIARVQSNHLSDCTCLYPIK